MIARVLSPRPREGRSHTSRWLATAAIVAISTSLGSAQTRLYDIVGDEALGGLGRSVRGGVDFDGDGVVDVLAGEPGSQGFDGAVHVFHGLSGALLQSFPGQGQEQFGRSLDWMGDVDGDTVPDLVVGTALGEVSVVSGSSGARLVTVLDNRGEFGSVVRGAGDLDGDGIGDFLASRPTEGTGEISAYSGSTGALLYTVRDASANELGREIDPLGDQDGDGVRDFIAAAPGVPSAAVLFSGSDGSVLQIVSGPRHFRLGASVAGGGELDGDGVPDYLVAAPGIQGGLVVAFRGADHSQLYHVGGDVEEPLHVNLDLIGDQNGDGVDDFAISVLKADVDQFVVRLYSGVSGLCMYEFQADDLDHTFGWTVAQALGDVDGDGFGDVVLGSHDVDTASLDDAGLVAVFRGDDLFMNSSKKRVFANDIVRIQLGEAEAGRLVIVFETIIGVGTFLKWVGRTDGEGKFLKVGQLPPGFAGLDLLYDGFALHSSGLILQTGSEFIELR